MILCTRELGVIKECFIWANFLDISLKEVHLLIKRESLLWTLQSEKIFHYLHVSLKILHMSFKQVFSYIHFLVFQQRNLVAIDFHLHWLHIRDFGVGSSMLICCGHIEVWKPLRDVAHFGEGVSAISHEIMNSVVKSVIMWIPRGAAGSTAWEERKTE